MPITLDQPQHHQWWQASGPEAQEKVRHCPAVSKQVLGILLYMAVAYISELHWEFETEFAIVIAYNLFICHIELIVMLQITQS